MQPPLGPDCRFTVRVDYPDGNEPEVFSECPLADLPEHLIAVTHHLDDETLLSAPIIMEVRRVK